MVKILKLTCFILFISKEREEREIGFIIVYVYTREFVLRVFHKGKE